MRSGGTRGEQRAVEPLLLKLLPTLVPERPSEEAHVALGRAGSQSQQQMRERGRRAGA